MPSQSTHPKLTLEQQRAQHAWERCANYRDQEAKFAKAAPLFIRNSGLMQFLCFCLAKTEDKELKLKFQIAAKNRQRERTKTPEHWRIAVDLLCWLGERAPGVLPIAHGHATYERTLGDFFRGNLDSLLRCTPLQYRNLTVESLAYLRWVRVMSEAHVKSRGKVNADSSSS